MQKKNLCRIFVFMLALFSYSIEAYIGDNRFFPILPHHWLDLGGMPSIVGIDAWVTAADKSINDTQQDIGIGEIFGPFDQSQLGEAMEIVGLTDPIPAEFSSPLPWFVEGRRQSQAIGLWFHYNFWRCLSVGGSCFFMRVNSRHDFMLNTENISEIQPGSQQERELDEVRRNMLSSLSLRENYASQIGFGDIDLYLRLGHIWDYVWKLRKVDAGVRLGLAIPSGMRRNTLEPASVPFGGDGHWGSYIHGEGLFEIKEDLKAGVALRVIKRFPRTSIQRMSAAGEPIIFGAISGNMRIEPGVTVLFSPFIMAENLRAGLGMAFYYWLRYHSEDHVFDGRDHNPDAKILKVPFQKYSDWGSEYFTLKVFYDFGKVKVMRDFAPILSFRWDIPARLILASRTDKAHRVVMSIDVAF